MFLNAITVVTLLTDGYGGTWKVEYIKSGDVVTGIRVTIEKVTEYDAGKYSCVATNIFGSDSQDLNLNVHIGGSGGGSGETNEVTVTVAMCFKKYIKPERQGLITFPNPKKRVENTKIRDVWPKCDQILSRGLDIYSKSKLKLRRKQINKIAKIYEGFDQLSKPHHGHDFLTKLSNDSFPRLSHKERSYYMH